MSARLYFAACVAILSGAFAAAGLAYGRWQMRKVEAEMRLDPLELNVYAGWKVAPRPTSGLRVVLFGDSRARSWEEPRDTPGLQFLNRGIGHQTTAQVLGRVERDVGSLQPDVVVLQAGINDLKHVALSPERGPELEARCLTNLREIVDRCVNLGAHVVLIPVIPTAEPGPYRRLLGSDGLDRLVNRVNNGLRLLQADRVSLLEPSAVIGEAGYVRGEFVRDYLHLNSAGYRALQRALVQHLTQYGAHSRQQREVSR